MPWQVLLPAMREVAAEAAAEQRQREAAEASSSSSSAAAAAAEDPLVCNFRLIDAWTDDGRMVPCPSGHEVLCPICQETDDACMLLRECGHSAHAWCLRDWLMSAKRQGKPLPKCVECSTPLHRLDVAVLLSAEEREQAPRLRHLPWRRACTLGKPLVLATPSSHQLPMTPPPLLPSSPSLGPPCPAPVPSVTPAHRRRRGSSSSPRCPTR